MWALFKSIGRLYCRVFHGHKRIAYAGRSQYRCRQCSRLFPVPWANDK